MDAKNFVLSYYRAAKEAEKEFGIHPVASLAQAAKESGWGESYNATKANNFFGMTKGNGIPSSYWLGTYRTTSDGRKFRTYPSPANSFLDFGRVIKKHYPDSAAISDNIAEYAHSISQSSYITDSDNRSNYRNVLVACGVKIRPIVAELEASQAAEKEGIGIDLPFAAKTVSLGDTSVKDLSGHSTNYGTILLIVLIILLPCGWLLATGRLKKWLKK